MSIYLQRALSGGFGSLMGTFLALHFQPTLWWLGIIAGFVMGAFIAAVPDIIHGAPNAWRKITSWRPRLVRDKRYRISFVLIWKASLVSSATMLLVFSIGMLALMWGVGMAESLEASHWQVLAFVVAPFYYLLLSFVTATKWLAELRERESRFTPSQVRRFAYKTLRTENPIYFFFVAVPSWIYNSSIKLARLARMLPGALSTIWRFAKHLHREVRKHMVLVAGLDAALGTAVGYYAGEPIIGMVTGMMFGIIDHLFSKRTAPRT